MTSYSLGYLDKCKYKLLSSPKAPRESRHKTYCKFSLTEGSKLFKNISVPLKFSFPAEVKTNKISYFYIDS